MKVAGGRVCMRATGGGESLDMGCGERGLNVADGRSCFILTDGDGKFAFFSCLKDGWAWHMVKGETSND